MIVEGYIGGVYYAVTVGAARPEAAATIGVVSGSRRAVLLLEAHDGQELPGSGLVVDVSDPDSVVAALRELTGDARVRPDGPPDGI
ncbi:hypothetical protein GCM10017673_37760 [Streptosporangium violaceochromogenes]|nr:hypothetical protein GCM10017673_37760 [Streptosporangium violaceochromogenes]